MFTGLIAEQGQLLAARREQNVMRLTILAPRLTGGDLSLGDSVAVNGICLTVVEIRSPQFSVQAVPETEERSTLPEWRPGDRLNLERPLSLNGRLDGHLVAGHVDGVGTVRAIRKEGASRQVEFQAPLESMRFIAEKGSIAIDGVSVTVSALMLPDRFRVALIPHTLSLTTLEQLAVGRRVNLEVDLMARYLERLAPAPEKAKGLTWESLRT